MILMVTTLPPCVLDASQQVTNKEHSTTLGLIRQIQKLDACVDEIFPNDIDSASIFRKIIGHKLFDNSISDLYMRCRMNFKADPVETQTP